MCGFTERVSACVHVCVCEPWRCHSLYVGGYMCVFNFFCQCTAILKKNKKNHSICFLLYQRLCHKQQSCKVLSLDRTAVAITHMRTYTLAQASVWALTHISVQTYTEHLYLSLSFSVCAFLDTTGKYAGVIKDEEI